MMPIPKQLAFCKSEYEGRIEQVQQRMAKAKIDALLVFSSSNVYYLSGMDSENQFDYQCLVVPAKGQPVLVLLDFELSRYDNSSWVQYLEVYGAFDDPIKATLSVLRKLGCSSGTIGVERQSRELPIESYYLLTAGLPAAKIVDPFGLVESCRSIKSPAEIALMQVAARFTDIGVSSAYSMIRSGVYDYEIAADIISAMYRNGSNSVCWGPIVAAGYRAGSAHSSFNGYRVKEGDSVFLELTGQANRYVSPLMRTVFIGKPDEQTRRIEAAVLEALASILHHARGGVRAGEVAKAALAKLEPVLDGLIFHHNFGYPVGIGYSPSWIERLGFFLKIDSEHLLKPGMTFHLPISLRTYGESAVNLSHTILVREEDAVPLGTSPAALQIID